MTTRIALIDDNHAWLELAKNNLSRNFQDFEIVSIGNYGDARKILQETFFDLIIIDIRLIDSDDEEDFSGLDLARDFAHNTPKIIVTGHPTFETIRQALRHSNGIPTGVDFVAKDTGENFVKLTRAVNLVLGPRYHSSPSEPIFGKINRLIECDLFIIMPFNKKFEDIHTTFKNASRKCNLVSLRGDDPYTKHDIINDIWSAINNCRLVIADCTGKNANVFYELGIAHTLSKSVILVTQDIGDIPFDIRVRRHINYTNSDDGRQKLEEELIQAIQSILKF